MPLVATAAVGGLLVRDPGFLTLQQPAAAVQSTCTWLLHHTMSHQPLMFVTPTMQQFISERLLPLRASTKGKAGTTSTLTYSSGCLYGACLCGRAPSRARKAGTRVNTLTDGPSSKLYY